MREHLRVQDCSSQSMTIRVMSSSCKRPEDRADQWAISPRIASASAAAVGQRMGFEKLLATRKAKFFAHGVSGFGQAVRVKHVAIAWSERDFE